MTARQVEPIAAEETNQVQLVLGFYRPATGANVEVLGALSGGYMNRNYLVQTSTDRFVLRRYDYNPHLATIRYEHSLLRFLPARLHEATVPKPLAALTGDTIVALSGYRY